MSIVHLGQRLVGIRNNTTINKNTKFTFDWLGRQYYESMW